MSAFDINISGLKELEAKLAKAETNIRDRVDVALLEGATGIATDAKLNAPGDQGILHGEIGWARRGELKFEVFSHAIYSAYVEFGTRTKVSIPPGLEEFAQQFKNLPGGSLGVKEAIFAWCKRKGIDPKAWYSIFISIMVKGTEPHPFFFPAVAKWRPIIIENVTKELNKVL